MFFVFFLPLLLLFKLIDKVKFMHRFEETFDIQFEFYSVGSSDNIQNEKCSQIIILYTHARQYYMCSNQHRTHRTKLALLIYNSKETKNRNTKM